MLVFFLLLSACTTEEKDKIDIIAIITEIEKGKNRLLVKDDNKGLIWVTLPEYEEGQDVAVWVAGGIDASFPHTTKEVNIEFLNINKGM